ncbi:MAG: hypothetical protein ACLP5H_24400 [Desulfomonilaceae bacterium]
MKIGSNKTTETIISVALEGHREFRPGPLESTYDACSASEVVVSAQISEKTESSAFSAFFAVNDYPEIVSDWQSEIEKPEGSP